MPHYGFIDDPDQVTPEEHDQHRAALLAKHMERIASDMHAAGEEIILSTRGCGGQAVLCLSHDGPDGKPMRFETSTAAGLWAAKLKGLRTLRGWHIARSIIRNGTAAGLKWAWASDRVPTDAERDRELKRKKIGGANHRRNRRRIASSMPGADASDNRCAALA